VAAPLAIRCLRDVQPEVAPAPVQRPRKIREPELETSEIQEDPMKVLERRVSAELDNGQVTLSEVTARIVAEYPENEHFVVAGRVADVVARIAKLREGRERPWVEVEPSLAIEQRDVGNQPRSAVGSVAGASGEIASPSEPDGSGREAAPEQVQLNWGPQ
jgi:hypothetical protein